MNRCTDEHVYVRNVCITNSIAFHETENNTKNRPVVENFVKFELKNLTHIVYYCVKNWSIPEESKQYCRILTINNQTSGGSLPCYEWNVYRRGTSATIRNVERISVVFIDTGQLTKSRTVLKETIYNVFFLSYFSFQ